MNTRILILLIALAFLSCGIGILLLQTDDSSATADPESGTQIGDLYYTLEGNAYTGEYTATVEGYSSSINWATFTTIPSTVTYSGLTYTVTTIGSQAFYECTNLALTSLPSTLTTIRDSAFYGCTSLALTSLPDGIRDIQNEAFGGCSNLALTELPSELMVLGGSAFANCTSLALTKISVGTIPWGAFMNCPFTTLYLENTASIGEIAFGSSTISTIILPDTLTNIAYNAFQGCTTIRTIYNASSFNLVIGHSGYGGLSQYADVIYDCHTITVNAGQDGTVTKMKLYAIDGSSLTVNGDTISSSVPYQTTTAVPDDIHHEFYRWQGVPATVTSNATIFAEFRDSMVDFIVTFVIKDESTYGTLSTDTISAPPGSVVTMNENTITINGITCTATPKPRDAQYTYSFVGWMGVPLTITGDTTITAVFNAEVNNYTIYFVANAGHWQVNELEVPYGTLVVWNGSHVLVNFVKYDFYMPTPTEHAEYEFKEITFPSAPRVNIESDLTITAHVDTYLKMEAFNIIQPQYPDMVVEKEGGAVWTLIMVIPIMLIVALIIYAVKFGRRDDGYNDF